MFTGLITHTAQVLACDAQSTGLRLSLTPLYNDVVVGESIAVNGVCLTVTPQQGALVFDVSTETLAKTTMGSIKPGDEVNIERALRVGDRMGGHYVSGHVDTVAHIASLQHEGDYLQVTLHHFGQPAQPYLVTKGSITVNGVSLTINEAHGETAQLMLIPHTLASTTLKTLKLGQIVNIEFDYLTRIVSHQLHAAGFLPE